MKKELRKKVVIIAMSLVAMIGIGVGTTNTFAAGKVSNQIVAKKAVNRKYTTYCKYSTYYLKRIKHRCATVKPGPKKIKNMKSSNTKVATVKKNKKKKGYYDITIKNRGKVTISCIVNSNDNHMRKGDVMKWIITIK